MGFYVVETKVDAVGEAQGEIVCACMILFLPSVSVKHSSILRYSFSTASLPSVVNPLNSSTLRVENPTILSIFGVRPDFQNLTDSCM